MMIEYALRQQRWREFQKVWRRIEWQRKRKQRRRGKHFPKSERNSRGCSDASPKFFRGFSQPVRKLQPIPSILTTISKTTSFPRDLSSAKSGERNSIGRWIHNRPSLSRGVTKADIDFYRWAQVPWPLGMSGRSRRRAAPRGC